LRTVGEDWTLASSRDLSSRKRCLATRLATLQPDGSFSFAEVKDAVRRVTTSHTIEGWDDKAFNRSDDLVTLAIVQTLTDEEMTSSETLEEVLYILRVAFACSSRRINASSDRQPRMALLLLEHLHNNTTGAMQSTVDETKKFLMQQASGAE
jgi:hypothetical protein